jgi:hypothetical protein
MSIAIVPMISMVGGDVAAIRPDRRFAFAMTSAIRPNRSFSRPSADYALTIA